MVKTKLENLNIKKATGFDNVPPKILKLGAEILSSPICNIINKCIDVSLFPNDRKLANVTPVFKKKDKLEVGNYRPVSILPTMSKIFEGVLCDQIAAYFRNIFHDRLAAFRPGFGCEHVLMRLVEDWRKALDKGQLVGAMLMDLSKAFDAMPHDLLLAKLKAYGWSDKSVLLIGDYLSNRKQRVKVTDTFSSWMEILKGIPQGSLLGPIIFNIFINDLFYFINEAELYNYADDNSLCYYHSSADIVKSVLEKESNIAIGWFKQNYMQANPSKFQSFVIGKGNIPSFTILSADNTPVEIECQKSVNLLGVTFDSDFSFNSHVKDICSKASRQINVLYRLANVLDEESRLCILKCFISCHFNYCPLIWHFCGAKNTLKLEKLQIRCLRFVYQRFDCTTDSLLEKGNHVTLHLQRLRKLLVEVFKIVRNLSPNIVLDLFKVNTLSRSRTIFPLYVPRFKTIRYGKNSLTYLGCKLWNDLDNTLKSIENIKQFRSEINKWNGPTCRCNLCKFSYK